MRKKRSKMSNVDKDIEFLLNKNKELLDCNTRYNQYIEDYNRYIEINNQNIEANKVAIRILKQSKDTTDIVRCKECVNRNTENCPFLESELVCVYDKEPTLFTANEEDGFCNFGARGQLICS